MFYVQWLIFYLIYSYEYSNTFHFSTITMLFTCFITHITEDYTH